MTIDIFAVGDDVEKDSGDSLPPEGGTFGPMDTGLYPMVIKLAYFTKSASGANALNLQLKRADDTGPVLRHSLWITSGKAKGGKNYYMDKSGKKHLLPDMIKADQLHTLITGNPLAKVNVEDKVAKLWSFDTRTEENTDIKAAVDLIDQPILVGISKTIDNKMARNANGSYSPTPEKREFNEIEKFFDPDKGHTLTEKQAGAEPLFIDKWKERFPEDYVRNKYKEIKGSQGDAKDDLPWDDADKKESKSTKDSGSLFS